MKLKRIILAPATVAAVLLIALPLAGLRSGSAHSSPKMALARLSTVGRELRPRGISPKVLRFIGVRHVFLLTTHGRLAFYKLATDDGSCFAVGPPDRVGEIGGPVCPQGFPSPSRPVLDLSIYETTSHDRGPLSLFRVDGIAADGIAAVAFIRPDGSVAARVRVIKNVFASAAPPHGAVVGLVAYDAEDREVWRSP